MPALEVNEAPIFKPASGYPYRVDLKSLVSNLGLDGEVNILSVEQISASGLATEWSQDNKFVRINRRGVITYRPKGTYLTNRLIIEFEAGDLLHPPTRRARRIGRRYESFENNPRSEDSESTTGKHYSPSLEQLEQTGEPVVATVALQLQDDIIGDPEKEEKFWQYQGLNPTCAIASVAAILRSLGVQRNGKLIDYEGLLEDVVVQVDANGDRIGDLPPILRWEHPLYEVYIDPNDGSKTVTLNSFNNDGWNTVKIMLEHYLNVDIHSGQAKHFSTFVKELEDGRKLIVALDAKELWQNRYFTQVGQNTDSQTPNGQNGSAISSELHAVWLTGIDHSDPSNPKAILNDPAWPDGASVEYPLGEFIAAVEDNWFMYIGTGPEAPDSASQADRREIESRLNEYLAWDTGDENVAEELVNSHDFYTYIQNNDIIDQIDAEIPGTKDLVWQYLTDLRAEEQRIFQRYGIDPATIDAIYSNADISEWLIENAPEYVDHADDLEEEEE